MSEKRVIVIGGGASGLMAAITAARRGAGVTILEHLKKPAKKILATGNGRCNMTNLDQQPHHYRGQNSSFVNGALRQFNISDTIKFFSDLGIYTKNRSGWIYPHCGQAAAVAELLIEEALYRKVKIKCNEHVQQIEKNGCFQVLTDTWTYEAEAVILAAGSQAAPVLGSDGSGYRLAESLGHTLVTPLPALVQLKTKEQEIQVLSGIRVDAFLTLAVQDQVIDSAGGEILFTNYGISGIPVLQLSTFAVRALHERKKVVIKMDFMNAFTGNTLEEYLASRIKNTPYKPTAQFLTGLLPSKLALLLLKRAGIEKNIPCRSLTKEKIRQLASVMKEFSLQIRSDNGFEQAQICSGGIKTDEIDEHTMASRLVPGLYLAGEIIDIDGDCGGYNLQWAWSSGYTAGWYAGEGGGA